MTEPAALPWRTVNDTVLLRVRLTPRGGRDAVDGRAATPEGPAIKARVRAAPEDGAANAALVALVAEWLGVARRNVSLAGGGKSRTKLVAITGDLPAIEARLRAAVLQLAT